MDPTWLVDERVLLLQYLRRGKPLYAELGYSFCRFKCGAPDQVMGCRALTDGTFIWPEGLTHYVDAHEIRLPEFFIEFARSSQWRLPATIHLPPDGSPDLKNDVTLWLNWWAQLVGT